MGRDSYKLISPCYSRLQKCEFVARATVAAAAAAVAAAAFAAAPDENQWKPFSYKIIHSFRFFPFRLSLNLNVILVLSKRQT